MTASRPRPRRPRRRRSARATYLIAGACALAMAGMLVLGATAQRGVPGADHYVLGADFETASNLGRYAEVRIAGRRVGQVIDVALRGEVARVKLQLDPVVRPLPAGTTAHIRLKGLLGAKYVELRPAQGGAGLRDGATLPVRQTASTVELFDIFEALDEPRRRDLQATLRTLGGGFLGRGEELNEALRSSPGALEDLERVAAAINARPGAAGGFAPSLDAAAGAFDRVRDDLARGWEPQARALAPLADRRDDLQATLDVAPSTLEANRRGLAASDPLLRETARLARSAVALTDHAPAALRETTGLLRESGRPLGEARDLLRTAQKAVAPTLAFTRRVDPLVPPLRRLVGEPLPTLRELTRRGCDVLGFGRNWRSMLAYGVPSGHPVGPETGLRVTVSSTDAEITQALGDMPPLVRRPMGYPDACAFGPVTPLPEGPR